MMKDDRMTTRVRGLMRDVGERKEGKPEIVTYTSEAWPSVGYSALEYPSTCDYEVRISSGAC